jgi:hypothetical protein
VIEFGKMGGGVGHDWTSQRQPKSRSVDMSYIRGCRRPDAGGRADLQIIPLKRARSQ